MILGLGLGLSLTLVMASAGIAPGVAHAAPGDGCLRSTTRLVSRLGKAAENAQATGRKRDAWRAIRDAVAAARRGHCQKHRSLGKAYLVLGIIEQANGRPTRMYSAWQKALRLDRALVLDPRFTNQRLRRAFVRLKKKLYPTAVRPRARPLPRARPRPRAQPRPEAPPPPVARRTPVVRQPLPRPYRPVARPAPSAPPSPPPLSGGNRRAGCSADTDRKGRRICDRGQCVYPRSSQSRAPVATPNRQYRRYRRAPAPMLPPRKPGQFAQKGTVELGLGVGLQYDEISVSGSSASSMTFNLDAYVGYFVADRFKLGFYFSVPFSKTNMEDYYGDKIELKTWEVDLIGAPGFAFPFGPTVFGFVDFLIGFAVQGGDTAYGDNLTMGLVGGEFGVKVLLGKHLIMKIGVKPLYLFGKIDGGYDDDIEVDDVRVLLALGFSAFW